MLNSQREKCNKFPQFSVRVSISAWRKNEKKKSLHSFLFGEFMAIFTLPSFSLFFFRVVQNTATRGWFQFPLVWLKECNLIRFHRFHFLFLLSTVIAAIAVEEKFPPPLFWMHIIYVKKQPAGQKTAGLGHLIKWNWFRSHGIEQSVIQFSSDIPARNAGPFQKRS